jgi:hypothetical protein
MLPTITLSGGCGLFEADVMRGDEVHERRRGMGENAVDILAVSFVDGFHAQHPNYLHARAAVWRERIRRGDYAAEMRCCGLRDMMLDHQCPSNHLDVDRHPRAVVCQGRTTAYVIRLTASLLLRFSKIKQPVGNVDFNLWNSDYMAVS